MYSYCGKVLWVDVGNGRIFVEKVPEDIYGKVLGGYGLGLELLLKKQPALVDPLGPENILGFLPGLLTGTSLGFTGRYMVIGKSPLTGGWGDANSGGTLAPEIKRCGLDGIFITGKAPQPVYLYINNDQVEIRDANHLWGLDTIETEAKLRAELGSAFKIANIGQAGENVSLLAAIINDRGRAAARSGLGAVMGSKKLKAIALKGSLKVAAADYHLLGKINRTLEAPIKQKNPAAIFLTRQFQERILPTILPRMPWKKMKFNIPAQIFVNSMQELGTGATTAISIACGDAPVQNWRGTGGADFPWEKASKIGDKAMARYTSKKYRCADCPLGCGGIAAVKKGKYLTAETHRPEYETAAAFGSNIMNDNVEAIIKFNDLCTRLGLDTISTGTVIGFAMECFEKGLLGPGDNCGRKLDWGDADAALLLTEDIGKRRGLGHILSDGVAKAAQRIGPASFQHAMHVGGQELPMHDPRFQPAFGATYVLDATPGRHTAGANQFVDMGARPLFGDYQLPKVKKYDYESMGAPQAFFAKQFQVLNCLGLCIFSAYLGTLPYAGMVNCATGWDVTDEELMQIGERILVMRQIFNLREGLDPLSFTLPDRVAGKPPLKKGPTAGVELDMETVRLGYYTTLGWDSSGRPDEKRCAELGINLTGEAEGENRKFR